MRAWVGVWVCVWCVVKYTLGFFNPQELFQVEASLYKLNKTVIPELTPVLMSVYQPITHLCGDS